MVTNLRGIFNDRIPAHIMSYVLSFARGLHIYARQQRESLWRPHGEASVVYLPGPPPSSSASATSGRRRPAFCAAFGMRVLGVDARRRGPEPRAPSEALDSLLPEADFVILTVPHTPSTEGLFDARFARMKRSAFFQHRSGGG